MRKRSMLELKRVSIDEFKQQDKTPLIIILDNIRSALNVGAAFRTADAFAIQEIALCGITAQPPHREILKTALGAHQSINWHYFETTVKAIDYYKAHKVKIMAVEQATESISLQEYKWEDGKLAVVMGNEVEGVSQEVLDKVDGCLEIPQFGTKHSLNISVSLGIVLWELFSQHQHWKK